MTYRRFYSGRYEKRLVIRLPRAPLGNVVQSVRGGSSRENTRESCFFSSELSDGYLHRHGVQRGFATLIWRGRHAVDPTELTSQEAAGFWADLLQVSRIMQLHFRPLKMNYQLLGNGGPHLH